MAGELTDTDLADVLKELYPSGAPPELMYLKSTFWGLLEKDEDFVGELYKLPIVYGDPQGRSADFTKAQTNRKPGKYTAFNLDTINDYGNYAVTGEAIDRTRNDKGAFVKALKRETDGAMRQLRRSICHNLFRNHGGALGQVTYTATQTTFTLQKTTDVVFLEVGQKLTASTADGTSGALRDSGNSNEISAINRSTGVITSATAWDTAISGFATNDYVFVDGDFGAKASGLDAWIPSSAPGATLFFNVNRSVDTDRLGGVRYDASTEPLQEGILEGLERVCENGGSPDVFLVHPRQFTALSKELGSKVQYGRRDSAYKTGTGATIGYRSIIFDGPDGPVDVISDRDCQLAVGWALQMDTWLAISMGGAPKMLNDDGLPYLRQNTADGIEGRLVARWQLGCSAPGWNGRITLPT